jgi:hypothetical protein
VCVSHATSGKNARATKLYFILGQMLEFIPEPLRFLPALATNNLADNKSLVYGRVCILCVCFKKLNNSLSAAATNSGKFNTKDQNAAGDIERVFPMAPKQ